MPALVGAKKVSVRFTSASATHSGLAVIARQVIGCRLTQETKVGTTAQNVSDDVVGNICYNISKNAEASRCVPSAA
jgi:hypothetical protein